jgi:hypothetical protein
MTELAELSELSGRDLRELASLADLRDQRRRNAFEALLAGPPFSPPTGPLLAEQLESAMTCLAHWTIPGLLKAADEYAAGRLSQEVVDSAVASVLRRRERRQL